MGRKDFIKGQKDGAQGKSRPPHDRGPFDMIFGYSKKERADRDDYRKGNKNSKKQR